MGVSARRVALQFQQLVGGNAVLRGGDFPHARLAGCYIGQRCEDYGMFKQYQTADQAEK